MAKRKPNTKPIEKAKMKALRDAGYSHRSIAKRLGKSHATVQNHLKMIEGYKDDKEFQSLVERIKESELADLELLTLKCRARLHERVDEDDIKSADLIALQNKSFEQKRLLRGQSTANVAIDGVDLEQLRKMAGELIQDDIQKSIENDEQHLKPSTK